jgi:hypothetical protein
VALLFMLLPLSVGTAGAAETFIRVKTRSNEYTNADRTYLLTPTSGQITANTTIGQPETISLQYRPSNFQDSWFFRFAPPAGQPLGLLRYDDAGDQPWPGQPLIDIDGPLGCSQRTGAFEIRHLERSGSTLTSLWATFEQSCKYESLVMEGEIRFNLAPGPKVDALMTLVMDRAQAFSVDVATEGFPERAPALRASGLTPGSVFQDRGNGTGSLLWDRDFTQAGRHDVTFQADDGLGRSASATMRLQLDGVTSVLLQGAPGGFVPYGWSNQAFYTPADGDLFAESFVISNFPHSYVRLQFRSRDIGFTAEFAGPDGALPQVGVYENAVASGSQGPGQPGLQITGNGHGCSSVAGRFEVKQVEYGPFNLVRKFWATFEHHCEGTGPAVFGEVRLNADPPVWLKAPGRKSTVVGSQLVFPVEGYSDPEGPVTFEGAGVPADALYYDQGGGLSWFFWTPDQDEVGPKRVTFTARDASGHTDTLATDITVFEQNDDIVAAQPITLPFRTTLDPFWATRAVDDPECGYAGNNTVWYSYTPAEDERLHLHTVGGVPYTVLGVFTGPRGALTRLACGGDALLDVPVSAGVTYFIMAGTSENGEPLALSVDFAPPAPPNDEFAAATPITALPFSTTQNVLLATASSDDPYLDFPPCNQGPLNSVWFSFTPERNMRVIASVRGSDFSAVLAAFMLTEGSLWRRECDTALAGHPPVITLDLLAGTTYYFMAGALFQPRDKGTLSFYLAEPFAVRVTFDPEGFLARRSGTVQISGSVTCSRPVVFTFGVDLGRSAPGAAHAFSLVHVSCDGAARWTATLDPRPGPLFHPGRSPASARATLYDDRTDETVEIRTDAGIRLSADRSTGRR